uniref:Uncharacterized protein n=1 Tax=Escherichia coli TaxID=562 RepID=A0A3S8XES7_ECOLX|nr:hypothetical protein [Escherichia coli]QWY92246.1 hypothetical protein p210446_2017_00002 [Escherichia coli]WGO48088.1 hypothetical protein [Escherichia coli]
MSWTILALNKAVLCVIRPNAIHQNAFLYHCIAMLGIQWQTKAFQ